MKLNIFQGNLTIRIGQSAHIYRQVIATLAACLSCVAGGLAIGHTAVLLPQLENNEDFPYEKSFGSWIASTVPLAMTVGSLFSGSLSDWMGRKLSQIILAIPFIMGWVIMGFANNSTMLLVGRFMVGFSYGSSRPIAMVYIAELIDPKYRSMALVCPSLTIHVGNLISHSVGKYVYWKTSCFIFAITNVMALIILMFLKESPLWLLTKDKIEAGKTSFKSFRGSMEHSENELSLILDQCREKSKEGSFKDNLNIIFSKAFMKSLTAAFLLAVGVQWCGVNTIPFYAEQIFQATFSGNIDAFLLMIASDCIRIIANLLVCAFARFFPQKKTLLISYVSTCLVLIALTIYLYLNPTGLSWLAITLIVIYMSVGTALTSTSWSFTAEIFPGKVRGLGSGIGSAMSFTLLFLCVKVTPGIMSNFGEIALYGGFAVITFVTGICLILILPETSGRTLQDIENTMFKKKENVKTNNDTVTKTLDGDLPVSPSVLLK